MQAGEWPNQLQLIQAESRGARDLSEADECYICSIDNGPWGSELFEHWCLGPRCEAKCGGNFSVAKDMMVQSTELSVDKPTSPPLVQRWKGVTIGQYDPLLLLFLILLVEYWTLRHVIGVDAASAAASVGVNFILLSVAASRFPFLIHGEKKRLRFKSTHIRSLVEPFLFAYDRFIHIRKCSNRGNKIAIQQILKKKKSMREKKCV